MLLNNFGFNQNFNAGNRFQFNPQALNNQANNLVNSLTQGGQSVGEAAQQGLPQVAQFAQENLPQVAQFARSNGADILNALDQGAVDLRGRIETFRGYPGRNNRNNRDVRVSQVTNEQGIPQRESQISIKVPNGTQITNPEGFNVQSMIANPLDGTQNLTPMNITRSEINGRSLNLFVDGPVSNGSQINIAEGALTNRRGQPQAARDITLDNPRKFQSPEQAALWGKAYEPANIDLFPSATYPGASPAIVQEQPQDEATVRQNLNDHFQKYAQAGELRPGQVNRLMNMFDNPQTREVFTDPATGQFEPHLAAMVLGTAGTPGQGSIKAIIGGKNETGRPARVVFNENLPGGAIAGAEVRPDDDGLDRWFISVNPAMRNEPFQVGSAFLAHEAVHQDNIQGQDEEVTGKSVEINTWKNHLLVDPSLATLGTGGSKLLNLQVMMQENSGQSFPNGGLFEAPLNQDPPNVVPGSNFEVSSLDNALRTLFYPGVEDVDTPGNKFLDSYVRQATRGQRGRNWESNTGFNDNTLAKLDNPNFFSAQENFQILQTLQLQPVIS